MYLSIPQGMELKQVIAEDGNARDYFVDPLGKKASIDAQDLIYKALKNNSGRKKVIELLEFTIYMRRPPATLDFFQKYTPNCNGKYATNEIEKQVQGHTVQVIRPKGAPGMCWFQFVPLSKVQLEEVHEKRGEQRENRRHTGDSPNPT